LFAVFHSVKKSSPDESDAKYPSGYYVVFRILKKLPQSGSSNEAVSYGSSGKNRDTYTIMSGVIG